MTRAAAPVPRRAGLPARPARAPSSSGLAELWRFRALLRSLVVRDLKVKYQRSVFGLVWTLLNPLLTMAVLVAVFSYVIRIEMEQYWAFMLSGYFVWNYVQQCLFRATSILREHAALSRSVAFPSEILILGAGASRLVEFLVEITIVLAVLVVFRLHSLPSSLLLLPILVVVQMLLVVGLMLPLSTISTLFHDVQHALPIVVMSLFYLSPVFYPVEFVPEPARPFFQINPMVPLLQLFHAVLYDGTWPPASLLGASLASSGTICAIGYLLFRRYRHVCVEIA